MRSDFCVALPVLLLVPALAACRQTPAPHGGEIHRASGPNVILVLTDDQGYADVGCYGARGFETPHLDRMAAEGVRFTDFHVSQAVCSASRAALLTGCYSERVSIQGALGPGARVGLNPAEETIAELLKERGYATGAFGKWHLGHHEPFLPTRQGFDEYFGLPYSNDMWPVDYDGRPLDGRSVRKSGYPPLRLVEGEAMEEEVRTLADQAQLTNRYTERALRFIEENQDGPFFLYLAHSMPHVPLGAPLRLGGRSEQGAYGDVISEIDDSMGRIFAALEEYGLSDDTLVIFTSDNGPWLRYGNHAGSAGSLREGKATMWEGGTRVPCIVRWPARIPAGRVCDGLASTIDLLPTIAAFTGARLPEREIDGVSLARLLEARTELSPRRTFYYYYGGRLTGVRHDRYKLVFPHRYPTTLDAPPGKDGYPGTQPERMSGLELYDLVSDRGETIDIAGERPELVRELELLADEARRSLGDRLHKVRGRGVRPAGRLGPLRKSPVRHLALERAVRLTRDPDPKYAAEGGATLVDGRLGSEDFTDGRWLGYQGEDFEAHLDLGESSGVRRVACSFLRSQASWIFLPESIEIAVSLDGSAFDVLAGFENQLVPDHAQETKTFAAAFELRDARHVRVRASGSGTCPDWHPGTGRPSWIFVDEIVVE